MAVLPATVRHQLDNGLRLFVVPRPAHGLASYWSVVRTGSRDEVDEGLSGFAHFFEHMMFRGTERFPGRAYDEVVSSLGVDANAFTTDDLTAYHLTVAAEALPTIVDLEADRFQHLAYDEREFRTEAGAILGEYRKNRANPFFTLFEGLSAAAFDVHPYRHTTMGLEADIRAMPERYTYSLEFFRRFYRPDNTVLLVAGDVDPDHVIALVEQHYAGWEPGYQPPAIPVEPPQDGPRRTAVPFPGRTLPVLALAWRSPAFDPADRLAVAGELVAELAVGATSPAYEELVLDRQVVDLLTPALHPTRDPGLWTVVARVTDPARTAEVEARIRAAVAELAERAVDAERLDAIRSHARYGFMAGLVSPEAVCQALARVVAMTGEVDAVEQLYATLDAVTPDDVREAAARWYRDEASTAAVLHSEDEAAPTGAGPARPAPVLLPEPDDPTVTIRLMVRAGSQDDPPGKEGLASLVADLVAEGATRQRTYPEILEALYPMAATYTARTDKEVTVVGGTVHRDHAAAFADLLLEAVTTPALAEEDLTRLRARAVTEVAHLLRYASEEELGKATLEAAAFAGSGYAHPVTGTVQGLQAITRDDVVAFHRQRWDPAAITVGVGGAFPPDLPDRLLAGLGTPGAQPAVPPPPEARWPDGRQVVIVAKPGPSVAISVGRPLAVGRGHPDHAALTLAASWLGEHRSSVGHLFQLIREQRGLNYGDYAYIEAFPGGGSRLHPPTGVPRRSQLFELWLRPVPADRAVFTLRAALRAVARLVADGLTEEQVDRHRRFLRRYLVHRAPTTAARLGYALDDTFHGTTDHLDRLRAALDELTAEQVNAAVRTHFDLTDCWITMVAEDAEALRDQLVSGAPTPIDYGGLDKPAEVLAEDAEIATFPLDIAPAAVRIVGVDEAFERGDR